MKTRYLFTIFVLLALTACGQRSGEMKKYVINQKARQLNDSACALTMNFIDSLRYVKAISLLNQATAIDSNYFNAYWNKFVFQNEIKQYGNSIETGKQLIKLKPNSPDTYGLLGTTYYLIGDSTSAKKYYNEALVLYDKVLDTMDVKNKSYGVETMLKGNTLIMLDRYEEGNKILKRLYDREKDEILKSSIKMSMNKTRREIIENIIQKASENN